MIGGENYFAETNIHDFDNLQERLKRPGYKSTHALWQQIYIGRIVVPIRKRQSASKSFDYMGFICADTLGHMRDYNLESYVQYLASFADNLYMYFKDVQDVLSSAS